jgi:6-pyruvoyl-tetrahydropterin synthase
LIKKLLVVFAALLVLGIIGYKVVERGISYKLIGYRDYTQQLDKKHLNQMNYQFGYAYDPTEKDLLRFVLDRTSGVLDFDMHTNALQNPNAIIDRKSGHCKMYSYVMTSSFNQLAKLNKISGNCRVAYGHVYLYGVNMHQFCTSSFFRDHDFCVVKDKSGVHAVDAILYDYLLIDQIRLRK